MDSIMEGRMVANGIKKAKQKAEGVKKNIKKRRISMKIMSKCR